MADRENREKVMVLTASYRILGTMRVGPDGSLWDFKHRPNEDFVTIFEAQVFRLRDGKRMYDAVQMELSRRAIEAVFQQKHLAFMRKEEGQ